MWVPYLELADTRSRANSLPPKHSRLAIHPSNADDLIEDNAPSIAQTGSAPAWRATTFAFVPVGLEDEPKTTT